jgi:hypothetical protein
MTGNFDDIIRQILGMGTQVSDTQDVERPTVPSPSKYDTLNMPQLRGVDFENMIRGKTIKPIRDET